MHGNNHSVRVLLTPNNVEFVVPPYQRNYQWEATQWQGIARWALVAAERGQGEPAHWLGVMLVTLDGTTSSGKLRKNVIDGQQRLVTLFVLLAALRDHAKETGKPIATDPLGMASVVVQQQDTASFSLALAGQWRSQGERALLTTGPLAAYAYFRYLLWLGVDALAAEDEVRRPSLAPRSNETPKAAALTHEERWTRFLASKRGMGTPQGSAPDCTALEAALLDKLAIFEMTHDSQVDEGEAEIFECLNASRSPLEQLDHVKNSLFVRLSEAEADRLYHTEWEPAEREVRAVKRKKVGAGQAFLYDWLISVGAGTRGAGLNTENGAAHFARRTRGQSETQLVALVEDDLVPAMLLWPISQGVTNSAKIAGVTHKVPKNIVRKIECIREVSSGPLDPIVLFGLTRWSAGITTDDELRTILHLTESYVVRQLLGGRGLSPLRSKVMAIMGSVAAANPRTGPKTLEALKAALLNHDWVDDASIKAAAPADEIGDRLSSKEIGAILRGIERQLSGAGAMDFTLGGGTGYSLEHIFPQKDGKWNSDLRRWKTSATAMRKLRETLGNLTVLQAGLNTSVSNLPLKQKQGGVPQGAPLKLNQGAAKLPSVGWLTASRWSPPEVEARTDALVAAALREWPTPT